MPDIADSNQQPALLGSSPPVDNLLSTQPPSVSLQDTKPTPHVQGARGAHIILETSIQFLWKRGHMPTHEDDLSRRLQSALERSRALRRHSQILGEMVQRLKSESTEIHIEAKTLLSSLSQQLAPQAIEERSNGGNP